MIRIKTSFAVVIVLALLLTSCVPIPPLEGTPGPATAARAVEPAPVSAPPTMIEPQQISLDTQGLPYSWQPNLVPATPYDASQPPGPMGLPEHIEINFGVTDPSDRQPGDPIMYIIPVDAYVQMWNQAGNPYVADMMARVFDWTVALQTPPPTSGLPALPPEVFVGVNDVAVQIDRAASDAQSASKSGYRFVGRWAQDANPVTAESALYYVYQGFTNDGRYLVSFRYPVAAKGLPKLTDISAAEIELFNSDPQAYIQAQADMLNALAPADWEPDLTRLDALVGSLRIEGMTPVGIQAAAWQWTGTVYPNKVDPVSDPAQYEVVYGSDGALQVKADCNRAVGTYSYQGGSVGQVRVQMGPSTLAECGPESRSDELIQGLMAAQDFRVVPGGAELHLNMPADGPVLTFRAVAAPTAAAPVVVPAEPPTATSEPTATVMPTATAVPTLEPTATSAPTATPAPTATVAPTRTAVPTATTAPTVAPTATLLPTRTSAPAALAAPTRVPTRTATPRPTATRRAAATATRTPIPSPTVDKHRIIITEADIAEAITGGKAAEQGISAQNLKVDFANGKIRVTADRLGYGMLQLQNLDLTGRLGASNGVLTLTVESMSPRGLAANVVPKVANQALAQFGSKWYVEQVTTLDGMVEVRIR